MRVKRTRDGVEVRLPGREVALLSALLRDLLGLLDTAAVGSSGADPLEALVSLGPTEAPDDPVLARLLPDAYDDDAAAAEFRRFTQEDLRSGKVEAARAVLDTLPESGSAHVVLDEEQGQVWLRAVNDLRLALGTRLGVTEETYAEAPRLSRDDPRLRGLVVYDWLTVLQDRLVTAVAGW